ncbi:MAG: WhiB family transcriptional regulator [Acidimicrobiia bacterium]
MSAGDILLTVEHWREAAACRDLGSDLFFPLSDDAAEQVEEAKAVCAGCSVREDCLAYALATGQWAGIWGGYTADERRRLRKRWAAA